MKTLSPPHALLGMLLRGEMHGYDLKRAVEQEFAPFWRIDFAQLYRSLAKMKHAGWVRVRGESSPRGPDRKAYSLTTRGRGELARWLAEPAHSREEFFVKLRIASDHGASNESLLAAQRNAFENARAAQIVKQRAAQAAGNPGQLMLAHAALQETQAALAALDFCAAMEPARRTKTAPTRPPPVVIVASDDPLLTRLAQFAGIALQPVGSIGGLMALAQQQADLAGAHLLDAASGEYNVPFVKHLLPEDEMIVVNLAWRENGLIIAAGNPRNIRGVRDLARRDLKLINRPRGTGTRLLLYSKLRSARIDPHSLRDWERVAATHDAVAGAIASGAADVGPGLRAVADAWRLDFIPLNQERYDLIIPRAVFDSPRLHPMLEALDSKEFRRAAATLLGYDLTRSGQIVARVK